MRFEYDEIKISYYRSEKIFTFQGAEYKDFMELLDVIGELGWEVIGEIEYRLIAKRQCFGDTVKMTDLDKTKILLDGFGVKYDMALGSRVTSITIDGNHLSSFDTGLDIDFKLDGSFDRFDN